MKKLFLLFIFLYASSLLIAQDISATVIEGASNKPLAGASVVAGKHKAFTNKEGRFSIPCEGARSITVSFVGYASVTLPVSNCTVGNIVLRSTETTLETVEVVASSTPNKELLYQPAAVAKLGKTALNRGTGLFLDDAIQTNIPGVSMNRRTVGGGQQLNIRGYGNGARGTRGPSSNFDGQGYKVYLNGIAVTDAEGITTFDDLDYGSLQNVELTKGPAGSLYGLAIAGAVNFTTIRPAKGSSALRQQVMIGNYGLQRYTTSFETSGERSSLLMNYGKQKSDGFSIHNKSHKDFFNLIADFNASEKQKFTAFFSYADSYDERFGELTIDQWKNDDYSGNPEYIKRDAHSNVVTVRAGLSHTYQFTENISNSTSIFGTAFNSNASSAGGWTDKSTMNFGLRSVFNTRFILGTGITLNGVTGIETQKQLANVIGYSMKKNPNDTGSTWVYGRSPYWVINAATSNVYTEASTTSLFTEWTLSLPADLSLTAGIGTSNQKLELNDRLNTALATRPDRFARTYNGMVSPHLAINKVFAKKFSVWASYSKGYKAPVTSYFYITTPAVATTPPTPPTGFINEDLKPEIGNQFEIGTRGELLHGNLFYELSVFNLVFSNKMTAVTVASPLQPNTTLYAYVVNGGKQIHNGLEANLHWVVYETASKLFRMVRPFANYTYAHYTYGDNFTFQSSPTTKLDYSNKQVAAVPRHSFNAGVDLKMAHGIYGNMTYNYRGAMPITSVNDYYTESYNLLNAKLGIQRNLSKHWGLDASFGVNNITNTKYFIMVFANQLPDAYVPAARNAQYFGNLVLSYKW